jgi:hypothetical protein
LPNYLIVLGDLFFDCPTAALSIALDPPNPRSLIFALFSAGIHTGIESG